MERPQRPSEKPFVSFMKKKDINNGATIIALGSIALGTSLVLGDKAIYISTPGAASVLGGMAYPVIAPIYRGIKEQVIWNKAQSLKNKPQK